MKQTRFASTVMKIYMKNQMQDRTNILLDFFNMFSRFVIIVFLYGYIFQIKGGTVNGVDYKTTMWSMFIYFCLMILNVRRLDKEIMAEVKSGNVEMYMNKPVSYLILGYMRTLGEGIFSFITISIVGTIIMILAIGLPNLNLAIFIPTFIITLFLGQFLGLLMYGLIGLMAFFMQDIAPLHWIIDKLVMLLGGSYLPISMFPKFMKVFAYISPFGAINFATSTVYESWNTIYIKQIGLQVIWILVFGLLTIFVFNKSKEKTMINGG